MEWISGCPTGASRMNVGPSSLSEKCLSFVSAATWRKPAGRADCPEEAAEAEGVIMESGRTYCAAMPYAARCDGRCSALRRPMHRIALAVSSEHVGSFIQAQLQAGNAVVWHGARRAICRSRHSLGQGRFRFLRPMPKPRARGVPDSRSGHPLPPVRSPLCRRGRWIGAG